MEFCFDNYKNIIFLLFGICLFSTRHFSLKMEDFTILLYLLTWATKSHGEDITWSATLTVWLQGVLGRCLEQIYGGVWRIYGKYYGFIIRYVILVCVHATTVVRGKVFLFLAEIRYRMLLLNNAKSKCNCSCQWWPVLG